MGGLSRRGEGKEESGLPRWRHLVFLTWVGALVIVFRFIRHPVHIDDDLVGDGPFDASAQLGAQVLVEPLSQEDQDAAPSTPDHYETLISGANPEKLDVRTETMNWPAAAPNCRPQVACAEGRGCVERGEVFLRWGAAKAA